MDTQNDLFLSNEEEVILSQIKELTQDLEAIRRLRKKYSANHTHNGTPDISQPMQKDAGFILLDDEAPKEYKPFPIPDKYSSDLLTWEQRCVFILNELGKADVEQVIKKIKERFSKENHQVVTLDEFCSYMGLKQELVKSPLR